jgi:hypothetical protein
MVQYIILITIDLIDLETFHGYCNTGNEVLLSLPDLLSST